MTEMLYFPSAEACYIREFDARIVEVVEGNGIVLDRTGFYPKGGGQGSDVGTLSMGGSVYGVREVSKVGGKVVHWVEGDLEGVRAGTNVQGRIDWPLRYGNMRMHTSQHLLSAIMKDLYKADTVGNQLYPDHARMDFSPLSKDELDIDRVVKAFEDKINSGLNVKIYFKSKDAILSDPRVRVNLDLIPGDIDTLRVVEIEGYDVCPCAGTHVKSLSELAPIEITKVKSKGKGRVRLTYQFRG